MSAPDSSVEVPNLLSIVAARGDQIVAADASDGSILKRESAEDISRLQSAANQYVSTLQYNIGDFVREGDKLFICKANTTPPEDFSFNNFRIPNNADLFGVNSIDDFIEDLPKFLGTETAVEENVKAYRALDISRARNASRPYFSTQEYAVGDFAFFDGRQVRNTTPIDSNGESFDTTHWEPADGLGVKNTKHIYTEADFPPAVTINSLSRHPLDNNTEYIISQPLTVETGLFVDAGFKVLMRSFSTEANVLTFDTSGTDILFSTLNFNGSFTGVVDAGTGQIQLTGMVTTNLQAGRHININQTSSTVSVDYSQLAAEIVSVDSGSTLTVKTSVEFIQTESGDWDNKARLLELERATFDDISSGTSLFIDATFTRFKTSEFFMFHCEAENFDNFGSVINANIAIYALNEFENINDKVKLTSCESVLIDSNNWRGTQGAAEQLIQIDDAIGESIANINNNNLFTTGTDTNAIKISSLTDTSRVIVTNNADLNPDAGSLFSDIDETDSRLIVKHNVKQRDSGLVEMTISRTDQYARINLLRPFKDTDKIANPASLPAGGGESIVWSPDGRFLALGHLAGNFITVYERIGTTFNKLAALVAPAGVCEGITWSPDGRFLAVAHLNTPFVTIYERDGITFTKLTQPVALPDGDGQDVAFSPNGRFLAVAHEDGTFVTIYLISGTNTFTKISPNPLSANPAGFAFGVAFSPNSQFLSVANRDTVGTVRTTIYEIALNVFTKVADPNTDLPGNGLATAWSPNSEFLAFGHVTSPFVTIYQRDGTTFTKVANPSTLPSGTGEGVGWSPNGKFLIVAHAGGDHITIYEREGTTFTKIDNPDDDPAGTANGVDWSPNQEFQAIAHLGTPFVTIYQTQGTLIATSTVSYLPIDE